MTNYIETETTEGGIIKIEVAPINKGVGFAQKSATSSAGLETENAYNQTMRTVKACASGFISTLQTMSTPPQNASMSFAIKVDQEAGVLVASNPENAQFKISLNWKQDEPEKKEG